jgi:hypothetical protein
MGILDSYIVKIWAQKIFSTEGQITNTTFVGKKGKTEIIIIQALILQQRKISVNLY